MEAGIEPASNGGAITVALSTSPLHLGRLHPPSGTLTGGLLLTVIRVAVSIEILISLRIRGGEDGLDSCTRIGWL